MNEDAVQSLFGIDVASGPLALALLAAIPVAILAGYYIGRALWRRSVVSVADAAFQGQLWNRDVAAIDARAQDRLAALGVPVILVANHKGGVGKTTLALNLGMFFARARGKRVLFVDLDYQGSLSLTLRTMTETEDDDFRVSRVFSVNKSGGSVPVVPRTFGDILPGSGFLDSDEQLAVLEERLMVGWAVKVERRDVRFRLVDYFLRTLTPRNGEAPPYDVVVIDAPPRSTTAEINAIAAASHLIVPTKLDRLSTEGVIRFVRQVTRLTKLRSKHLRNAGFVGSMAPDDIGAIEHAPGVKEMTDAVMKISDPIGHDTPWERSLTGAFIAQIYNRREVMDDAGVRPTVLSGDTETAQMFRNACEQIEIALRINGAKL